MFHSGHVFHQLVCPLTVVLPQIKKKSSARLFSYPVFLSLFHAPLDVVLHLLVFFRSFKLKSFLSQFSPIVAQIKNFCSDNRFFFFGRCLPRISLAVSVTAVLTIKHAIKKKIPYMSSCHSNFRLNRRTVQCDLNLDFVFSFVSGFCQSPVLLSCAEECTL